MADGESPGIVHHSSRLEHDVGLAPHELTDREERVAMLTSHFMEIASGDHSPHTVEYLRGGGSLRLCLTEIMALSDPCEHDQEVRIVRAAYMGAVLQKRGFLKRHERKQAQRVAEGVYIDAVVAKMDAMLEAESPEDALELGQMPTLVERASFRDGETLSEEDLAANHLYLLVDTALKEHVHRRHAVERHQQQSRVTKIASNRQLNMGVAGGVLVAALTPKLGVLPAHGATVAESIEYGLQILSGTILGLSGSEAIRLKYLQVSHDRRSDELQDDLAENQRLADLALRMTYNSTRYGNLDGTGRVTGRSGTDDKEENLRRFARLDREFPHLNNDPGGKPYTGDQALGYAARLLIEREDQIREIIDSDKPHEERKQLFLDLVRDVMTEDLIRMKKGLNVSRFRRWVINVAAAGVSAVFPRATSTLHEATTLSQGTKEALSNETEK